LTTEVRAIKGHVYLANNKNDESLVMFISLQNDQDKSNWLQWSENFKNQYKNSPIASYLYGDALVRKGDVDKAVLQFEHAEKASKKQLTKAMILNATGLANLLLKNPAKAQALFEEASKVEPGFADAHASLGGLLLKNKLFLGSLNSFSVALKNSDKFSLAIYGRLCASIAECKDPALLDSLLVELEGIKSDNVKLLAENLISEIIGYIIANSKGAESSVTAGTHVIVTSNMKVDDISNKLVEFSDNMRKSTIKGMTDQQLKDVTKNLSSKQRMANYGARASEQSFTILGFGYDVKAKNAELVNQRNTYSELRGMAYSELISRKQTVMNNYYHENNIDKKAGGISTKGIDVKALDFSKLPYEYVYGLVI
jgi:tetratricopeptide (TPR) repeat protein